MNVIINGGEKLKNIKKLISICTTIILSIMLVSFGNSGTINGSNDLAS